MANLTVTIDEHVLRRARIRALEHGTSVNALVAEYLARYADPEDARAARGSSWRSRSGPMPAADRAVGPGAARTCTTCDRTGRSRVHRHQRLGRRHGPGRRGEAASRVVHRGPASGYDLVLSAHVIGESYVTVTRKLATPVTQKAALAAVRAMTRQQVVPLDSQLAEAAVTGAADWRLSYWDALLIVAARSVGVERLLTEDLQHASVIEGVRIENPFLTLDAAPDAAAAEPASS